MSEDNNPLENREPASFVSDELKRLEPLEGAPVDDSSAEFQCKVCGQVFTNQADLNEHMLSHERMQDKVKHEDTPAGVG